MRYDIDLKEGRRGWSITQSLLAALERLQMALVSTPFILTLVVVLALGVGYYGVYVPLFRSSPFYKSQLRELNLMLKGIAKQREELIGEAEVAYKTHLTAPGWTSRILAFGEHVPEGLWLNRLALEEEKPQRARGRRTSGERAGTAQPTKFLVIEGQVDTGPYPSSLELISQYLRKLNGDPRIREVVHALHLVSSEVKKGDPTVVTFHIRGPWKQEPLQGKLEDRIENWLKINASQQDRGS
jgi:hypothetical protein